MGHIIHSAAAINPVVLVAGFIALYLVALFVRAQYVVVTTVLIAALCAMFLFLPGGRKALGQAQMVRSQPVQLITCLYQSVSSGQLWHSAKDFAPTGACQPAGQSVNLTADGSSSAAHAAGQALIAAYGS